ncbi:MAG: DUF4340 domain-containing protein [Alphaproteobacteria bacterium]|nr:DUF4340 domain-containing protein [Alphaproteobacteria bacterium]
MKPNRFLILAGVTAAVTAGAVWAYLDRAAGLQGAFLDEALLPGLSDRLNDVAAIGIDSPDETFSLEKTDGGWVIPEKAGYPVLDTLTRPFLIALRDMTVRERKTADPERHRRLDLRDRDIPGSQATRITLTDPEGNVVADVLFGAGKPGAGDQAPYHYVRRAGEDQTWLAQADLRIRPTIGEWIDRGVANIPRADILSVTVTPPQGPSYGLVRSSGDDFTLADLAEGETVARPSEVNALAGTLSRLIHDDVRPDDRGLPVIGTVRFTLENGEIAVELTRDGDNRIWVRFNVGGQSEHADEIAAKTEGWLYDLGEPTHDRLTAPRNSFIE